MQACGEFGGAALLILTRKIDFDEPPPFDDVEYLRTELPSLVHREEVLQRKLNDFDKEMARKIVSLVQRFPAAADLFRRSGLSVVDGIEEHLE